MNRFLPINQQDMAERIPMNQSNYSKIERDLQEPNLEQLKRIVETEGYYFLYTDIRMAHILPKKHFSQGAAAQFGKFVAEKSGLELEQNKAK